MAMIRTSRCAAAGESPNRRTAPFIRLTDTRVPLRVRTWVYALRVHPQTVAEAAMSNNPLEHHGQAAYHHESATKHHRAAENAYGSGNHKAAAHEAQMAQSHSVQAKHHADLAVRVHMEHHGMAADDDKGVA